MNKRKRRAVAAGKIATGCFVVAWILGEMVSYFGIAIFPFNWIAATALISGILSFLLCWCVLLLIERFF